MKAEIGIDTSFKVVDTRGAGPSSGQWARLTFHNVVVKETEGGLAAEDVDRGD